MQNFTNTAIRLYRQIFGTPKLAGQLADGIETVLDGNTAVAITEACMTEVAAIGAGFLEQGSAFAWLAEQQRVSCNLFAEKLSVQQADSPRGALASAIGVSLSGHRSTVFLNTNDIAASLDLLNSAVSRHLPLVVHLDNRLSAAAGSSPVSGHDAIQQLQESGCIILFAANIQQAVDFTLIARRVAEITMTPAVVVMDGIETALAIQDVRLPSAELVRSFIGHSSDLIDSPSVVQKQLFSEQKQRVHCWHNLDKPILNGALYKPRISALANAAKETFFDNIIAETLDDAYAEFYKLTGRRHSSLSTYALKKSDVIVLAQGSAIETLQTMSDLLKSADKNSDLYAAKINLGVIGLHSCSPFDSIQIIEILRKNKASSNNLIVLERSKTALSDESYIVRNIRGIYNKYLENKENTPILFPELHSIIYGLGGEPLNISDCFELLKSTKDTQNIGRYLGIPFTSEAFNLSRTKENHPKRQVMIDTLQRYYPQINELGIFSLKRKLALSSKNKPLRLSISSLVGTQNSIDYALELSHILHKTLAGFIRCSGTPLWEQWGKRQINTLIHSEQIMDAGQSALVDYFIVLANSDQSIDEQSILKACESLNQNGVLIFSGNFEDTHQTNNTISSSIDIIKEKSLTLYNLSDKDLAPDLDRNNDLSFIVILWEKTLATLFGVLLNNQTINTKSRKLSSIRQTTHEHIVHSDQSQQEYLIDVFKETLNQTIEDITAFDLKPINSSFSSSGTEENKEELNSNLIPEGVKKLGQISSTMDSLPRFWDQVGILQKSAQTDQLTADPYLATATIPSLSATFNDMSELRHGLMPSFDPRQCTACGDCWSNCPDSAIATVVISPKNLLETGIKLAKADSVRPIVAKLAKRISKNCRDDQVIVTRSREVLNDAFVWFKENAAMDAERLNSIESDFNKLVESIAELPLVTSDLFFHAQEKKQNDSGEFFSLVINPDTCKACGLCVELCFQEANDNTENTNALSINHESQLSTSELKKQWQIWHATSDTNSATIERVINEDSMDTGSVLMLSRYNAFSLSGGDHAEPASGEKIAMRQLLSATEYHQQPLLHRFLAELDELREKIKLELNDTLSVALPTANLGELSKFLSDVKTRQVDLNDLLDKSTQSPIENNAIDAVKSSQLVNLVLQINELHWKLSEGSYGLGRSRYSLCITSNSIARWAGAFPNNPFHVPVTIDVSGESAQVAAGLVHGQVNELLSAISIMRTARANIDKRYAKETESLDNLQWDDLTAEEKQLCPPLLLVGGDDLLGSHGFSQIASMLNSAYPVKIVIFNELDGGLKNTSANSLLNSHSDSMNNLAMIVMSQRNSYVAQTSIADNNHLQQSVHELLNNSTAGLLSIHTPSPSRHGFDPIYSIQQAQLAVTTRMFPLFSYNPKNEGIFGSRLSLVGNNDIKELWSIIDDNNTLTPAIWAMNESRFKNHFSPLGNNSVLAVELSDWLKLSAEDQNKKIAYVVKENNQGEAEKIAISKQFSALILEKQNVWQTLQELAGIVTPFTNYVEEVVTERLSTDHQAELDALKAEYDDKVKQLEQNYNDQTHTKIRNQLLGLVGYDANNLN